MSNAGAGSGGASSLDRATRPERLLLAIGLIVASTVFFAGGDVGAKLMKQTAPAALATWLRYFVLFLVALPYAYLRRGPSVFRPTEFWLQVGRGAAAVGSTTFFILGLAHLSVSDATSIHFIAPILVMVMSIFLLGEVVKIRRWLAAAVGFAGVLLIVRPCTESFQPAAVFPLCSATAWALGAVFIRMIKRDPPETTFLWTGIVGLLGATVMVLPVFHVPTGMELVYGLGGSISFAMAQLLIIVGFRMAPLSILAPITYMQLISAGVMSYLFFDDVPSYWTLAGTTLIAGSGLYSAHRERLNSRRQPTPSERSLGPVE